VMVNERDHAIPEEPTPEQIRALVDACPTMHRIHSAGPWGATWVGWCCCGWDPDRQPPEWLKS
jgi:hypothetical protein